MPDGFWIKTFEDHRPPEAGKLRYERRKQQIFWFVGIGFADKMKIK
jgi:hypothetical protein